mmetsp:Transcript_14850/g.32066  ORF Transcript_14850/g.32066 Transcript_14850/m.32066 type:complete len:326 (-) Transcript_14850:1658-2635(-)
MVVEDLKPLHGGGIALHLAVRRPVVVPGPEHDAATGLHEQFVDWLVVPETLHAIAVDLVALPFCRRDVSGALLEDPTHRRHGPPKLHFLQRPSILLGSEPKIDSACGIEDGGRIEAFSGNRGLQDPENLSAAAGQICYKSSHARVPRAAAVGHFEECDLLAAGVPLDAEEHDVPASIQLANQTWKLPAQAFHRADVSVGDEDGLGVDRRLSCQHLQHRLSALRKAARNHALVGPAQRKAFELSVGAASAERHHLASAQELRLGLVCSFRHASVTEAHSLNTAGSGLAGGRGVGDVASIIELLDALEAAWRALGCSEEPLGFFEEI